MKRRSTGDDWGPRQSSGRGLAGALLADRGKKQPQSEFWENNISSRAYGLIVRRLKSMARCSTASGGPPWFGEVLPPASFSGVLVVTFASWGRSPRRRAQTQRARAFAGFPNPLLAQGHRNYRAFFSLITPRGAEAPQEKLGVR
jgi:hypothetical protein